MEQIKENKIEIFKDPISLRNFLNNQLKENTEKIEYLPSSRYYKITTEYILQRSRYRKGDQRDNIDIFFHTKIIDGYTQLFSEDINFQDSNAYFTTWIDINNVSLICAGNSYFVAYSNYDYMYSKQMELGTSKLVSLKDGFITLVNFNEYNWAVRVINKKILYDRYDQKANLQKSISIHSVDSSSTTVLKGTRNFEPRLFTYEIDKRFFDPSNNAEVYIHFQKPYYDYNIYTENHTVNKSFNYIDEIPSLPASKNYLSNGWLRTTFGWIGDELIFSNVTSDYDEQLTAYELFNNNILELSHHFKGTLISPIRPSLDYKLKNLIFYRYKKDKYNNWDWHSEAISPLVEYYKKFGDYFYFNENNIEQEKLLIPTETLGTCTNLGWVDSPIFVDENGKLNDTNGNLNKELINEDTIIIPCHTKLYEVQQFKISFEYIKDSKWYSIIVFYGQKCPNLDKIRTLVDSNNYPDDIYYEDGRQAFLYNESLYKLVWKTQSEFGRGGITENESIIIEDEKNLNIYATSNQKKIIATPYWKKITE